MGKDCLEILKGMAGKPLHKKLIDLGAKEGDINSFKEAAKKLQSQNLDQLNNIYADNKIEGYKRINPEIEKVTPFEKVVKLSDLPERAFAVGMGKEEFDAMKGKIEKEGFTQPIIIDKESGNVLDGQHRLLVAESLGIKEVPAIYMDNPTKTELNNKIKELEAKTTPDQPTQASPSTASGKEVVGDENLAGVKNILDDFENSKATENDIADVIENLDIPELKDAIDKFREEQEYDRELSGRGDMDTANDNLMAAVEKYVKEQSPTQEVKAEQPTVLGGEGNGISVIKPEEIKKPNIIPLKNETPTKEPNKADESIKPKKESTTLGEAKEDKQGTADQQKPPQPPNNQPPKNQNISEGEGGKDLSGIKKALVSEDIIKGVDLEKIGDKEMMAMGRKILDSGEVNPDALVTKIITDGRGVLAPHEVVGLITYKRDIDTAVKEKTSEFNKKKAAGEDTGTLGVEIAKLEKQIEDYNVMSLITAQQQSLAFRLRQYLLDQNYNAVTKIKLSGNCVCGS